MEYLGYYLAGFFTTPIILLICVIKSVRDDEKRAAKVPDSLDHQEFLRKHGG